jgi:hypothetical protein
LALIYGFSYFLAAIALVIAFGFIRPSMIDEMTTYHAKIIPETSICCPTPFQSTACNRSNASELLYYSKGILAKNPNAQSYIPAAAAP